MNVLLLTSHSIAEHDDLDMFTRMGVPTFSIGAYTNPQQPSDDKRPPLPDAPYFPAFEARCHEQRVRHGSRDARWVIDWAKGELHPDIIDWADTIIVHHFPEAWIGGNWDRIRDKRVIWRTCGQSDPRLESVMAGFRAEGLQIVRYSPKEREAFPAMGAFAGEDVMIRFGKDPTEWSGWTGTDPVVGNITQHMRQRADACGYDFWQAATEGLPVKPAGPGSEVMRGGIGALDYEAMRQYLRDVRVYLYTGTRPASYTLGLIEAMMTGTPVVTMGAGAFFPSELYEADAIVFPAALRAMARELASDPKWATTILRILLDGGNMAREYSLALRARAIDLFGLDGVMAQWRDFLGLPEPFRGWEDTTPYFGGTAA